MELVTQLRNKAGQFLGCDNPGPINEGVYQTDICGHLGYAWAEAAGEPGKLTFE